MSPLAATLAAAALATGIPNVDVSRRLRTRRKEIYTASIASP